MLTEPLAKHWGKAILVNTDYQRGCAEIAAICSYFSNTILSRKNQNTITSNARCISSRQLDGEDRRGAAGGVKRINLPGKWASYSAFSMDIFTAKEE
jgi:hypothetical protein